MNTLQDYESACQQATNSPQREQIALEALNFLMQTTSVPGDIVDEINQELAKESASSGGAPPLPETDSQMNDALCAELEARLANFFPGILYLKTSSAPEAVDRLLTRVRTICQNVDNWRGNSYWTDLFNFLNTTMADQWRKWRIAVIAQQKARAEIGNGDFERAKKFAVYGLKSLANISDRRLYLDLSSRLENAIAEGDDACFRVASALGDWVVKESLVAGHYLRAVGMLHNLGNQHFIAGKNEKAITALEQAKALCAERWPVREMSYYEVNLLERLARAYLNRGDMQKASDHLERFGVHAQQPREHALYHLGKGHLALHKGDYQTAEQEFDEARKFTQGQGSSDPPKDFFNLWSAYVSLGLACLKLNELDEARQYLENARQHGRQKKFLKSPGRMIHDCLLEAEISIQSNQTDQAETALKSVEDKLNDGFDSPRRQMQLLLTKASLREQKPKPGEDPQSLRQQALQKANNNGFNISDIDLLKIAVFG